MQQAYATWLNPPEWQLYDLQQDPWEWHNLADNPDYDEVLGGLQDQLRKWQIDTDDQIVDRKKLTRLLEENDAVAATGRRWPADGWNYLKYFRLPSAKEETESPTSR